MRLISFALTTPQVRERDKDVTRRTGWITSKPGDVVQPVVKGIGLKKGERVEKIGGPIRFVSVRRESLALLVERPEYGREECRREGFPELTPEAFVAMFARTHGCATDAVVTRLEFEYVDADIRATA